MTGAAGVLSFKYFSGTVAALVSATMKKPPSGMMGLSPPASSASTSSCLCTRACVYVNGTKSVASTRPSDRSTDRPTTNSNRTTSQHLSHNTQA